MPLAGSGSARVRIEGVRPILEAIRAGRRAVHGVTLGEALGSPGLRELESLARERGIPVTRGRLGEHRALADADPLLEEPFESILIASGRRFLVALDRVTDVGNLGSIARSAEFAGATGLVLEHRHAPPIEPGVLRASAGALEHLRVGRTPGLARALDLAKVEGLLLIGADPAGEPLEQLDPRALCGDLLVVLGSEDRGLRRSIREAVHHRVGVPRAGRVDSLGVAAAAAYVLLRLGEIRRDSELA